MHAPCRYDMLKLFQSGRSHMALLVQPGELEIQQARDDIQESLSTVSASSSSSSSSSSSESSFSDLSIAKPQTASGRWFCRDKANGSLTTHSIARPSESPYGNSAHTSQNETAAAIGLLGSRHGYEEAPVHLQNMGQEDAGGRGSMQDMMRTGSGQHSPRAHAPHAMEDAKGTGGTGRKGLGTSFMARLSKVRAKPEVLPVGRNARVAPCCATRCVMHSACA